MQVVCQSRHWGPVAVDSWQERLAEDPQLHHTEVGMGESAMPSQCICTATASQLTPHSQQT